MKVLHVITGLSSGGAEQMLLKILREHSRSDVQSYVLSLGSGSSLEDGVLSTGASLRVYTVNSLSASVDAVRGVAAAIDLFTPDIVQGWMVHGNLFASLGGIVARFKGPLLWNVRMSARDLSNEVLRTRVLVRSLAVLSRHPRRIIYNSTPSALDHQRRGYCPVNSVTIGNGFECSRFKPDAVAGRQIRAELGIPAESVVIGFVAHYRPDKDHSTFLRAAALTLSQHNSVYFILAGLGVDRSNAGLTRQIDDFGLAANIRLLGLRADVPRVTASFDIAVLCSRTESFPNAAGEAMACGVPCVLTDVGDAALLVGDTGLIVPSRNPEAASQAWIRLIENAPLRRSLGVRARERVLEHFTIESVARRYLQVYRELLLCNTASYGSDAAPAQS